MKTWLNKLRISWAMDSGKPLPDSLRRAIAANPELQHFARQTQSLEAPVKSSSPTESPMHDSIMRAVRDSRRGSIRPERKHSLFLPWAATGISIAAVALIFGAVQYQHYRMLQGAKVINAAVASFQKSESQLSEKVTNTMPFLLTPYSNELARVDRNLNDTKEILLASFP